MPLPTAKFNAGGDVAAEADLRVLKDLVPGADIPRLGMDMSANAGSLKLVTGDGASFPSGNFTVRIEAETIFIPEDCNAADVCTPLVRGVDGTVPAAHLAGTPVNAFISASHHNQLAAEIIAVQEHLHQYLPRVATQYVIIGLEDVTVDEPCTVTVQVQDQFANIVATEQRNVTLLANGSAIGAGVVNIVDGIGTLNINNQVPETVNFSLSDTQSTGLDVTSTQDVVFVPGAAVEYVILDPVDGTTEAAIPVTVEARDQFGNVASGEQRDVTLLANGSATGAGLVAIVNGVGTLDVSDQVAETVNLSLSDTEGTGLTVTSVQDVIFARPIVAWINAAGGAWETPENWSPARVPLSSDEAVIALDATYLVTVSNTHTVGKVAIGGGANNQTLRVLSTTLTVLSGGVFNTATIDLSAAGVLTVTSGGVITNVGVISSSGGTDKNRVTGELVNQGTISAAPSNLQVNGGGRPVTSTDGIFKRQGQLRIVGTPLTLGLGTVFTGTGLMRFDGDVTLASDLTLTPAGSYNLRGKSVFGTGTLIVQDPLPLHFSSANVSTINVPVNNQSTITAIGTVTLNDVMTNRSGATFIVNGTAIILGSLVCDADSVLRGTGTVDASGGVITEANGKIMPATNTSAGVLTILGPLPLGATAEVDINLGGTTVETQYDRLVVSGAATLAGTLNVTFIDGFMPTAGDQFTILTFDSHAGVFATENLPAGVTWEIAYNATSVVLTAVSVP